MRRTGFLRIMPVQVVIAGVPFGEWFNWIENLDIILVPGRTWMCVLLRSIGVGERRWERCSVQH